MLPGPVSIPPPLPEMARHASDALWLNVMIAEVQALGTGRQIRIDICTVFNCNFTENKTQCNDRRETLWLQNRWEEHNKRHLKAHKTTLPFMPRSMSSQLSIIISDCLLALR